MASQLLALLVMLGAAFCASGQTTIPGNAHPPPHPAAAPPAAPQPKPGETVSTTSQDLDYATEPMRIESIGMTMRLPLNADLTSTQTGTLVRATIRDKKHNWIINVETPRTQNVDVTVEDAAKKTLENRMFANTISDAKTGEKLAAIGTIIDQVHKLKVAGVATPGERFYLALPDGKIGKMVQGYTIFKVSPQQFVAFELICAEALFPDARRVYESAIATLRIQDPEELDSHRRDAITAGTAFINRLTPSEYDAVTKQPAQLYRLYKPAASGSPSDAEEKGYRTLRFFKATRNQIDPKAVETRPTHANPSGYIAEVKARLVDNSPTGETGITDVEGRYFMSDNRKEEAWSVRMIRQDRSGKPVTFSETGTRSGTTMNVVVKKPGSSDPMVQPTVPADGYLNQVEVYMLPRLLVTAEIEADLGFYSYNWVSQNVTLRRDSITQEPTMPGVWKLTTRPREGAEPLTYLYRKAGELIRGDLGDGMVMEPIWPAELERLWKAKGLPTGAMEMPKPSKGKR